METNEGISYGVFECFSVFQIAKKIRKLKNVSSMKKVQKHLGCRTFSDHTIFSMFMISIEKKVRFFSKFVRIPEVGW